MTGVIKKIVKERGFGFITSDDGGDDVFFHRSRLAPKAALLRPFFAIFFDLRFESVV